MLTVELGDHANLSQINFLLHVSTFAIIALTLISLPRPSPCRNCLIRESPTGLLVKIADFAILRSSYAKDYRTPRIKSGDGVNDEDDVDHYGEGVGAKEILPLRWIPWEVYTLVSNDLEEEH